jgi:ureidoacrylate peracid hydrolase
VNPPGAGPPIHLPARPEPLAFVPATTALIVVDMQNAYLSPGGYVDRAGFDISGAASTIIRTGMVVDAARAAGVLVVFLQNGWDPAYIEAGTPGSPNWHKSNALRTMRARPELAGTLLARGTWDHALVPQLAPRPEDIVVAKTRYSGFFHTDLDSVLRSRGIRTLVLAGVATNVCVESTVRDGFHLEYFCVVLADATHHLGPPPLQRAALKNIERFFGWVSTVEDLRAALGSDGERASAEG